MQIFKKDNMALNKIEHVGLIFKKTIKSKGQQRSGKVSWNWGKYNISEMLNLIFLFYRFKQLCSNHLLSGTTRITKVILSIMYWFMFLPLLEFYSSIHPDSTAQDFYTHHVLNNHTEKKSEIKVMPLGGPTNWAFRDFSHSLAREMIVVELHHFL